MLHLRTFALTTTSAWMLFLQVLTWLILLSFCCLVKGYLPFDERPSLTTVPSLSILGLTFICSTYHHVTHYIKNQFLCHLPLPDTVALQRQQDCSPCVLSDLGPQSLGNMAE